MLKLASPATYLAFLAWRPPPGWSSDFRLCGTLPKSTAGEGKPEELWVRGDPVLEAKEFMMSGSWSKRGAGLRGGFRTGLWRNNVPAR